MAKERASPRTTNGKGAGDEEKTKKPPGQGEEKGERVLGKHRKKKHKEWSWETGKRGKRRTSEKSTCPKGKKGEAAETKKNQDESNRKEVSKLEGRNRRMGL